MNRDLAARLGILAIAVVAALGSVRGQVSADDASETERQSAIRMQRFVVAATRIQRNPWRYTSVDGIEVLTRASEHDTDWWIDALRRGRWLEDKVMPADWLPRPQVPYTVIIDDTDLATVPTSELHALPMSLHAPDDPLTWDYLSKVTSLSTDYIGSYDTDTLALNTNVNGNDTTGFNYGSMTLERLSRNQPPLPRWLLNGILAENFGIFREGYDLLLGLEEVQPRRIVKAAGPGTLWVSTEETKRMLEMLRKNRHDPKVEIAPLDMLFSEAPSLDQNLALWQSEAALFARWGLMGPGRSDPAMYHAFQELVRRGRSEPITEAVFTQCFGFGYAAMKVRLDAFLQDVIAKPTSVKWDMPSEFLQALQLKEATSDQIGRILGDWLRMKGDFVRETNPELSRELLYSAGRMLERSYREDNGLPPDVEATHGGEQSGDGSKNTSYGSVTTMKAFVVSAERIHDPRLLAVYGMYEHDTGDDVKARELLEAATKAEVNRPRAYAVLAQMRYAEAMAAPAGEDSKLSAGQAEAILRPLETTLQLDPTSDLFELVMATWTNCSAKPSAADIREIERGVDLYPRNTDLAYNAAVLCAQSGFPQEAARLIDKGLVFTTHEINREYFEQLRATLGTPSPK